MQETSNSTTIRDIDIPFSRLILIILKVMLASIPAVILFYITFALLGLRFVAIFGGGAAMLEGIVKP